MRPHGRFNVAKCVQYLRHVGVEVSEERARSWKDAEHVHRFLGSTRRTAREGVRMSCRQGHSWTAILYRRGSGKRGQEAHNREATTCPECGRLANYVAYEWWESRDGSVRDRRPKSERWKPLDSYCHTTDPDR